MEGLLATDSIRGVKIQLLAFATAADVLGTDQLELELIPPATVSTLRDLLLVRYPAFDPLWPRLAVAVDGELVSPDTDLKDGSEVALLPPVSGGSGRVTGLTHEAIDVDQVAAAVRRRDRGAVLLFLGTVRDHHQGRPVTHLTYSAYRPMATRRLQRIVQDLEAADTAGGDVVLEIVHRLGAVGAGDASVVIAVASPHREVAYQTSRRALERLKTEVPIWKREHFGDGDSLWREEEPLIPAVSL